MGFKRYENGDGSDIQAFVDKSLTTCPLCEEQPYWHLQFNRHHEGGAVMLRCDNCYAILKIDNDYGTYKDKFEVISHGVYVKNDLEENCLYKISDFTKTQEDRNTDNSSITNSTNCINNEVENDKLSTAKNSAYKKINYSNPSWSFLSAILIISLFIQIIAFPLLLIYIAPSDNFTTTSKLIIFASLILSALINWAVFSTLARMNFTIKELCKNFNKEQDDK